MKQIKLPDVSYEKNILDKGFKVIAGIDEVGRGCFAGPVVAGCVVFNDHFKLAELLNKSNITINDSKKLNANVRKQASDWIKENSIWGIGKSGASVINRIGLTKATNIAFRKAIRNANHNLAMPADFLLIDAFYIPYVRGLGRKNQLPIIKGDGKSLSIAAASIIAKVYRDELMEKIGVSKRYGKYKWTMNKGYGTKDHREAILKYGITSYHRRKFVSTFLAKI